LPTAQSRPRASNCPRAAAPPPSGGSGRAGTRRARCIRRLNVILLTSTAFLPTETRVFADGDRGHPPWTAERGRAPLQRVFLRPLQHLNDNSTVRDRQLVVAAAPWRARSSQSSSHSSRLSRLPARRRGSAPAAPPRGGVSLKAAARAAGRCRRCGSRIGPWRACGSSTSPRRARGGACAAPLRFAGHARRLAPVFPGILILPAAASAVTLAFQLTCSNQFQQPRAPLRFDAPPTPSFIATLRNRLYDKGYCRCGRP
jgi:hypothetical protein